MRHESALSSYHVRAIDSLSFMLGLLVDWHEAHECRLRCYCWSRDMGPIDAPLSISLGTRSMWTPWCRRRCNTDQSFHSSSYSCLDAKVLCVHAISRTNILLYMYTRSRASTTGSSCMQALRGHWNTHNRRRGELGHDHMHAANGPLGLGHQSALTVLYGPSGSAVPGVLFSWKLP
jgi:hypothetical protein